MGCYILGDSGCPWQFSFFNLAASRQWVLKGLLCLVPAFAIHEKGWNYWGLLYQLNGRTLSSTSRHISSKGYDLIGSD